MTVESDEEGSRSDGITDNGAAEAELGAVSNRVDKADAQVGKAVGAESETEHDGSSDDQGAVVCADTYALV